MLFHGHLHAEEENFKNRIVMLQKYTLCLLHTPIVVSVDGVLYKSGSRML